MRADQFAFCAALFEALVGAPAFRGDTPEELARDKRDATRQLAGRARSLPRALVKVVERRQPAREELAVNHAFGKTIDRAEAKPE